MKTNMLLIATVLVGITIMTIVAGCSALERQAKDPNSTTNRLAAEIDKYDEAASAMGSAASSAGLPWGWVLSVGGAVSGWAVREWQNYRKKYKLGDKLHNVELTSKAIVDAVEGLGAIEYVDPETGDKITIGNIVKSEVQERLKERDFYNIGRAVINGLKSGANN